LRAFPEQGGRHRGGIFVAQRIQPKLQVMAFAGPFVAILRAVVDQQEQVRAGNTVGQQVEQGLSFGVDPMEVLKD
jgi:hypothetical protein